jgi:hypothetical protein
MGYVRYIDKTREYYLSEGYDKPYRWARHDDIPFTPMKKPLAECRVGLVSTSDVAIRAEPAAKEPDSAKYVSSVYSVPSDTRAEVLVSRHDAYDHHATHLDDADSYFPITRLREFAEQGRFTSVAPHYHCVGTAYSQRKTTEIDSPEILDRCRAEDVDVVLLTPV